jgi:hypothetical protein
VPRDLDFGQGVDVAFGQRGVVDDEALHSAHNAALGVNRLAAADLDLAERDALVLDGVRDGL